jgi:hypothetical protein
MDCNLALFPRCSRHGKPTKRHICRECNAAYMRGYLRRRRYEMPGRSLWDRARKRAKDRGLPFALAKNSIAVPLTCPALGMPIQFRGRRSACSPSLDRIVPERGYVPGNVRVVSDRANRLKGRRSLKELQRLSRSGPPELRADYAMIATYVEREQLLQEVRTKALRGGRQGEEWAKIAAFLDRVFRKSLLKAVN